MMDPGWLSGSRSQRGPEDQGTFDGGNDPVGMVRRYVSLFTTYWFVVQLPNSVKTMLTLHIPLWPCHLQAI